MSSVCSVEILVSRIVAVVSGAMVIDVGDKSTSDLFSNELLLVVVEGMVVELVVVVGGYVVVVEVIE